MSRYCLSLLHCMTACLFVLAGCASTGSTEVPAANTATAISRESPDDNMIVSGKRIGKLHLGMSTKKLYEAFGSPTMSIPYANGRLTQFNFQNAGLVVGVDNGDDAVCRIQASTAAHSTPEGVHVGSTDLETRAKLGKPAKIFIEDVPIDGAYEHRYLYAPGLTIRLRRGVVTEIVVQILSRRC